MKKYKQGDVREDGLVFNSYKNGKEYWTTKEQIEKNKICIKKWHDDQVRTKEGHAKSIFRTRKSEAKRQNVPFTIELDEVLKNIPDICPVLGIELSWGERKGKGDDSSPSLDKFDPKLGYISGNVYWISFRANKIKQDATLDEVKAVAKWMEKQK
jgi:hypothetical protein